MTVKPGTADSVFYANYHKLRDDHIPQDEPIWLDWMRQRVCQNFPELYGLSAEARVVDLPCGNGFLVADLATNGFCNITAIDLSPDQIEHAKNNLIRLGGNADQVTFECTDGIGYLQSRPNSCDAVVTLDMLEHLDRDRVMACLQSMFQSLKPGGLLCVRVPNALAMPFGRFYEDFTHVTPFTAPTLRQCLVASEFEIVRVGYEEFVFWPDQPVWKQRLKQPLRRLARWFLATLMQIKSEQLTENLVAVAKKPLS